MRWKRRSINQEEDRNKERCRDSFSHRCSVPSLFSSFPENTGITLFLLPVIFGSVCSDFSSCNYYNYHSFGGTGETEIDSLSSKIFSGTDRFDWNVNDRCGKKSNTHLISNTVYEIFSKTMCYSLTDYCQNGSLGKVRKYVQRHQTPAKKSSSCLTLNRIPEL